MPRGDAGIHFKGTLRSARPESKGHAVCLRILSQQNKRSDRSALEGPQYRLAVGKKGAERPPSRAEAPPPSRPRRSSYLHRSSAPRLRPHRCGAPAPFCRSRPQTSLGRSSAPPMRGPVFALPRGPPTRLRKTSLRSLPPSALLSDASPKARRSLLYSIGPQVSFPESLG